MRDIESGMLTALGDAVVLAAAGRAAWLTDAPVCVAAVVADPAAVDVPLVDVVAEEAGSDRGMLSVGTCAKLICACKNRKSQTNSLPTRGQWSSCLTQSRLDDGLLDNNIL